MKDLTDSTFIIPIRIESDDRLRNVITTLCYLLSNFRTNIIIKEVDEKSVFLESALPQVEEFCERKIDINHIFEKSDDPSFHRQKVLNDMLMEVETDIVVNYDCDILLPKKSYLDAHDMISSGNFDLVYPYGDGIYQKQIFATDELVSDFLNNDFDFNILEKKSRDYDAKYGFCQFFNKTVYIEGGMENENFVAYAPEDVERYYRFNKLGYSIGRINSTVYHLEHVRTHNSWFNNPFMQSNNEEWDRIQKMDPNTLRNYILNLPYYRRRIHG